MIRDTKGNEEIILFLKPHECFGRWEWSESSNSTSRSRWDLK